MSEEDDYLPIARLKELATAHEQGRPDPGIPIPDCCDFCRDKLSGQFREPQLIEWRTSEREVDNSISAATALTILAGVVVRKRTVEWEQKAGIYFLCKECRLDLCPDFSRALPSGIKAVKWSTALGLVFAILLRDPFAIWGGVMLSTVAVPFALWFGMNSRYKGYPTTQGFSLHKAPFETAGCAVGCLVSLLFLISVSVLGAAGQGLYEHHHSSKIEVKLARAVERSDENDLKPLTDRLVALAEATHLNTEEVGRAVMVAWLANPQKFKTIYRGAKLTYLDELLAAVKLCPKTPLQEVAEALTSQTPAGWLARRQDGLGCPPFPSEAKFAKRLERIRRAANAGPGDNYSFEVAKGIDKTSRAIAAAGGKIDLLRVTAMLDDDMAKAPVKDFNASLHRVLGYALSHPAGR